MARITAAEIAQRAGGAVEGDGEAAVTSVAALEHAGADQVAFITNARYVSHFRESQAGVILAPRSLELPGQHTSTVVRVDDPYMVLTWLLPELHPSPVPDPGIHPTAIIGEGASVGDGVHVAPYVVIGNNVRVGPRTRIGAHCVLEDDVVIGDDCVVHPHVTLHAGTVLGRRCVVHSGARVGGEGFRFVPAADGLRKVPQIGGCVIGDDVEIGANTTVDRGALENTTVGAGTKIDNLVQVAHNVTIGRHSLLIAQVGIAGGSTIGDGVVLAGQAGVSGHVSIGSGARVGAKAGVIGDVDPGETVSGFPARPHREAMKAQAALFRLPSLLRRLQELERRVLGDDKETE